MSVSSVRTVRNYMASNPVHVQPDTSIHDAIALLLKHRISGVVVVDSAGSLVGFLSEKDCLDAFLNAEYYESPAALVKDVMTTQVATVDPDMDILQAARLFSEKRFHQLPVLQQGRLVGQISRIAVVRAIQAMRPGK